jgi:uncharacterized protein YaaR (DUF327 family)
MKVKDLMNNTAGVPAVPAREERKAVSSKGSDFRSHLNKIDDDNYQQELEALVDRITKQGEKLGKKVDVGELRQYKLMISEFLETAVGKSRKFTKQNLLDRRGRHKVYSIIKKINEELDQLTQDVMKKEAGNIDILKRVDDIRGLILDMIL